MSNPKNPPKPAIRPLSSGTVKSHNHVNPANWATPRNAPATKMAVNLTNMLETNKRGILIIEMAKKDTLKVRALLSL